jgi:hypothetical protein
VEVYDEQSAQAREEFESIGKEKDGEDQDGDGDRAGSNFGRATHKKLSKKIQEIFDWNKKQETLPI